MHTFVHNRSMLEAAEHKIEEAQKRAAFIENGDDGDGVPDAPPTVPAPQPDPKPGPRKE